MDLYLLWEFHLTPLNELPSFASIPASTEQRLRKKPILACGSWIGKQEGGTNFYISVAKAEEFKQFWSDLEIFQSFKFQPMQIVGTSKEEILFVSRCSVSCVTNEPSCFRCEISICKQLLKGKWVKTSSSFIIGFLSSENPPYRNATSLK